MDYENTKEHIERHVELSFNKKFYVNTDISNFYPSIYSHSIPWALIGFDTAKKERDPKKWFNKIDMYQRLIKRNETNGIPIGPASSNIISESILARIDKTLKDEGFVFIRFIDDYTAYFYTYEKAEEFIRRLSEELSRYKLLLNIKKTSIKQLPFPSSPEWIIDLTTRMPDKVNITPTSMIRFLEYALNKQAISPDGSVLKYAIKTIIYDVKNETTKLLLQYTLNLCITYPILIPLLDTLFEKVSSDSEASKLITEQLLNILDEHAINKRSDAMTWVLYYLNKFSQSIPEQTAKKVIKSGDCIAILFLYLSNQYDKEIVTFCNELDEKDLFLLDQYWLLLYQLFFEGKITNPYQNKDAYTNHLRSNSDTEENAMKREIQVFNILKSNGVSFIDSR
ncbi:MAG TPA: RNA-directed DNA polymerase [Desulfobacteria bacterium]|nr:RNA-directed DNA polymerase [Desulfobacteria bacterium]